WGRAAVLVVDQSPLGAEGDAVLAAALAAAVEAAVRSEDGSSGPVRSVHTLRLGRDGVRARFLLGGRPGVDRVRGRLDEGVPWGEALVRLHQPDASSPGGARGADRGASPAPRGDA